MELKSKMKTIIELVKNNTAKFVKLKDKQLQYIVDEFEFPIPLEDTEGATFLAEDEATLFKRRIRKHIQYLEESKKEVKVGKSKI